MGRLRDLPPELRLAAVAAVALAASLLLPWYEKSFFASPASGGPPVAVGDNLSAFGVFTFVEAAVLLVAAGVLWLVWARAQGRGFHLPGGDGSVVVAAGAWAFLLLAWRLFDKPAAGGPGATVGIQWGILGAFLAAAALVLAGARLRAAHRPEPPNPAESFEWEPAPRAERATRAEPADHTAVTEVLRDRPAWRGEPPEAPDRPGARAAGDPPDAGEAPTRRMDEPERLF